jgi:high affinity sulfate transporter 1
MDGSPDEVAGGASRIARIAPGLAKLLAYDPKDLPSDFVAGISVAAVALPVGVAYAQLAGFPPVVGLYASILPLVAYAAFGTSRQLIVGPDAATCALVAAAIAPLAAGDAARYQSLSVVLAALAGGLCILGSFLRLGALADLLSKPILVGFMNGIALSIGLGQIGKLLGVSIEAGRIVPRLLEVAAKLGQTHGPTLAVGLGSFVVLQLSKRWLPRVPAALVTMTAAGAAVALVDLDARGVGTVGPVPAGLPALVMPSVPLDTLESLLGAAAGLALVSFTSMTLTARSFAARNRYDIDTDREFAALGVANLAAALSQGFAISGADSRTAMGDAAGGRTQVTGLVAAAAIAGVLLFLTGPLSYVPIAALGAVLIAAAVSLVDLDTLRFLWRIDRRELAISVLATLGVVAVGPIKGILAAVILALLRFLHLVARPTGEVLGEVAGHPGFHALARHPNARTTPGLLLFRFNGPIVFFNAAHFKRSALAAADAADSDLRWLVLDLLPVTIMDATGLETVRELFETLRARGVQPATAGRKGQWLEWATQRGYQEADFPVHLFPNLRSATHAYATAHGVASQPPPDPGP